MKLVTRKLFNGECYEEENNAYCFFGANNCCFICVVLFLIIFHIKKYTNADFNIEAYKSNIDKDNDGIDDQTDILNIFKFYI